MKRALKKYAKMLKKKLAYDEILTALKPAALEELKGCPEGQAALEDIEFNLSTSTKKVYTPDIQLLIDGISNDAKSKVETIKNQAELSGKVDSQSTKILVATLPKSAKERVLSKITDYRKQFGL